MRTACCFVILLPLLLAGCPSVDPVKTGTEVPRTQSASKAGKAAPTAAGLLLEAIGEHRLALVGELHGTRETPALVGDAVERLATGGEPVILALEIATREQPAFDAYLESAGTPPDRAALLASPHWSEPTHDGRDSVAMFDLVERIRALHLRGNDIALALFDPETAGDRNRGMADTLRKLAAERSDSRMVVLTGNMHATVAAPEGLMAEDATPIEAPMTVGRYLRDLDPASVYVNAASGEFRVCTNDGCKLQAVGATRTGVLPRLERQPPGQPWHAILFLPAFTASPPAVTAEAK